MLVCKKTDRHTTCDRNLHETLDHMFGYANYTYSTEFRTAGAIAYAHTTKERYQIVNEKRHTSSEFGCGANKPPNYKGPGWK